MIEVYATQNERKEKVLMLFEKINDDEILIYSTQLPEGLFLSPQVSPAKKGGLKDSNRY